MLIAAIASNDRRTARAALEVALRLGDDRRASFVAAGLRADDPEIRRIAGDTVRTWRKCPNREDILQAMFADRYMPVRRLGLLARIDEPGEKRRISLIASLLDAHRSMRQLAQYYLSRDEGNSPKIDVRAFYLKALGGSSTRALKAAILGLAETGTAADAELLKQFIADTKAPVAAAAVECVALLAAKDNLSIFESLMADTRPAVIRQAALPLIKAYQGYSVERLRAVVLSGPSRASRLWALRVLTSRHPFDALVDIVFAVHHVDPAVHDLALARARGIFRNRCVPRGPSNAEIREIRSAIQSQKRPLPPELERIIQRGIGSLMDI